MKPITEYFDYRQYILDYYKERKATSKFTWRQFAKSAGFASPVYLKQVCDGRYNLSSAAVERVGRAMELVGSDATYFRMLARLANAKTERERVAAYAKLLSLAEETRPNSVREDAARYFESYKGALVREIATAMNSTDGSEISKVSIPRISESESQDIVQLLIRLGILHIDSCKNVVLTSRVISMQDESLKSTYGTRIQHQMGELALNAMDNLPLEERSMSGLTFGTSEESFEQIKKEIAKFRKKITSIVCGDPRTDKVFRLNLQLFPLTQKIPQHPQRKRK